MAMRKWNGLIFWFMAAMAAGGCGGGGGESEENAQQAANESSIRQEGQGSRYMETTTGEVLLYPSRVMEGERFNLAVLFRWPWGDLNVAEYGESKLVFPAVEGITVERPADRVYLGVMEKLDMDFAGVVLHEQATGEAGVHNYEGFTMEIAAMRVREVGGVLTREEGLVAVEVPAGSLRIHEAGEIDSDLVQTSDIFTEFSALFDTGFSAPNDLTSSENYIRQGFMELDGSANLGKEHLEEVATALDSRVRLMARTGQGTRLTGHMVLAKVALSGEEGRVRSVTILEQSSTSVAGFAKQAIWGESPFVALEGEREGEVWFRVLFEFQ
jgi:hypothetical protein